MVTATYGLTYAMSLHAGPECHPQVLPGSLRVLRSVPTYGHQLEPAISACR